MLDPLDCLDCKPAHLQRRLDSAPPSAVVFSSIPFVLTWIATALIAQKRLFPALANDGSESNDGLPIFTQESFKPSAYNPRGLFRRPSAQKLASAVFSTSIGLSTVLVELLLCEISNTLNPAARGLALRLTLRLLLVLIVLVTPALEIHALTKTVLGASVSGTSTRRTSSRIRTTFEAAILVAWLLFFWYIPQTSILRIRLHDGKARAALPSKNAFTEACLERIGIIGISLMASLAGFAAVSSLWQTFGVRHRQVREQDVAQKEAGLSATEEMLITKQSRLRALQRKMSEAATLPEQEGYMSRMIGSLRGGSSDTQELKALQMEVSGLSTMQYSLSSSLSNLRNRHAAQQRSLTPTGKVLQVCNTAFAVYCAYRILATSLSSLRRWWQPTHSFAASDPINHVLALLTTHYDQNLDRAAWSRQISFLLSGVMLLAAFNSVLQTFRLFARFAPSVLQHAQTGLPLIISQIAGAYVISSALLLRSNLPAEVGGVISEALGAPLEAGFVEAWFESWFLVAVVLTSMGILIGRKVGGSDDWDDDDGVEMGSKRN